MSAFLYFAEISLLFLHLNLKPLENASNFIAVLSLIVVTTIATRKKKDYKKQSNYFLDKRSRQSVLWPLPQNETNEIISSVFVDKFIFNFLGRVQPYQ